MTSPDPDDLHDEVPGTDTAPAADPRPAGAHSGGLDLDLVRKLRAIKLDRSRHNKAYDSLGDDVKAIVDELMDQFAETGQRDVSVDDFRATPKVTYWGTRDEDGGVTEDDYYGAFEAAGEPWASLVTPTVNAKTFAAMLGRIAREGKGRPLSELLPPEIAAVVKINPKYDITFATTSTTAAQTASRSRRS